MTSRGVSLFHPIGGPVLPLVVGQADHQPVGQAHRVNLTIGLRLKDHLRQRKLVIESAPL
jgi:hypothetical protein